MTASSSNRFTRVLLTTDALGDLRLVQSRSPSALREVFRQLTRLDRGEVTPTPLNDYGKTGDLSDCGKIVVEVPDGPEYRILVRSSAVGYDVVEVLVVEAREGDLAYLLAGLRLGRLTDPLRRSDAGRRIARLRRRLDDL